MNLYLFPEAANQLNGYGIAIEADYERMQPVAEDIIIWYSNMSQNTKIRPNDIIINRPKMYSIRRFIKILTNRVSTELNTNQLKLLKGYNFENIYCDDVLFYSVIRRFFPNNEITVRFHNCFSRIYVRKKILKLYLGLKFEINLQSFYHLERKIFTDRKVNKIFISEEDKTFYEQITGMNDAKVWKIDVNTKNFYLRRKCRFTNKLVWFGGIEAHKEKSIEWFISNVFPIIKYKIPNIEFHLWGSNTKQYNFPARNIYGHGFYNESDFPFKEEALYINPDIIGGGVKIKLKTYLENNIPFISTPFGFEGYSTTLIDDKFCIISNQEDWAKKIINLFQDYK